jgi:hypothetical protein
VLPFHALCQVLQSQTRALHVRSNVVRWFRPQSPGLQSREAGPRRYILHSIPDRSDGKPVRYPPFHRARSRSN